MVLLTEPYYLSFSFREVSKSIYTGIVQADDSIVTVEVPENITEDIAGNKNFASNHLRVRHCM